MSGSSQQSAQTETQIHQRNEIAETYGQSSDNTRSGSESGVRLSDSRSTDETGSDPEDNSDAKAENTQTKDKEEASVKEETANEQTGNPEVRQKIQIAAGVILVFLILSGSCIWAMRYKKQR